MIRLRTLGALDLRDAEGRSLRAVLAQPKRAALVAYLALAVPRGPRRRDAIVALLWPEQDDEHARNALSQAVWFVRRALGASTIVASGDQLGLDRSAVWCDAAAFEDALEAGRLADAVEQYRGELLPGFHVANAPEFERWLESERARLAARYVSAVERLAVECDRVGDHGGSVAHWRRLAAHDPFSSRIALRLMRALVAAGDPASAIQHARTHDALLREELGVAPDAAVPAFVAELHRAAAARESLAPRHALVSSLAAAAVPAPDDAAPVRSATPSPGAAARDGARAARRRGMLVAGVLAFVALALTFRSGPGGAEVPPIRSIAALPVANPAGDSAQQRFADAINDALITALARYPDLRVISRGSVVRYRDRRTPIPAVARALRVDGIVQATLVREGSRLRLDARLLHGPSARHLWSKAYVRDVRDVLLLQTELAADIARELGLDAPPAPRLPRAPTSHRDSAPGELALREHFLRGRHAELSRSLAGIETARAAYRRALELDSTYAPAWAGLAGVYGFLADYDYAPMEPSLDTARMMARRAMALDSMSPETRTALAVTLGDAREFAAAERAFQRAIALAPSNARAHYWYSILLIALGRGEEALAEAKRALALDPFSPRGALAMERYATFLLTGDRPHTRLPFEQRRPILKLEPGEPWARAWGAIELAQVAQCDSARAELGRARALVPRENMRMFGFVGIVDWRCGDRAATRRLLAHMRRIPRAREHGLRLAWIYAEMGEKDSAFAWLEHHRWTMAELSGLRADRAMDPLRSDPRFPQLLRRIGVLRSPE